MQETTPNVDLLAAAREAVQAKGTYVTSWSGLRQSHFPGTSGWTKLQAWCAENEIGCEICYGQSSRTAEVQFRRLTAAQRSAELAARKKSADDAAEGAA